MERVAEPMRKGRLLIIGHDRDAAYALRNVFETEPYELEVTLGLEVAKGVMRDRHVDLVIVDATVCMDEGFDLIDYQLDHGLDIPLVLVGGESTGIRRKIRSKKGITVEYCDADGFRLITYVKDKLDYSPA